VSFSSLNIFVSFGFWAFVSKDERSFWRVRLQEMIEENEPRHDVSVAVGEVPGVPNRKRIRWVGARRALAVGASNNRLANGDASWNVGADWAYPSGPSPKSWLAVLSKLVLKTLKQLPPLERIVALREVAEAVLEPALFDLGREERIQLMNMLLPLIVRVFPLADLDLQAAFPVPTSSEHTRCV
jgi:hypothetical protein